MTAARSSAGRVVVADDSRLMRQLISDMLGRLGYDVVAQAADGDEAMAACRAHRPDAMTLDLHMPGLDGIAVLRELRTSAETAPPVVVVSAFSPAHGARAVDALAEGAVELLAKPKVGAGLDAFQTELDRKLQAAISSRVRTPRRPGAPVAPRVPRPRRGAHPRPSGTRRTLLIASSTGGPQALSRLVPKLPARIPGGGMIVQHMPAGFTSSLAQRLDGTSRIGVREAAGGEALEPGALLLAPGGSHLRLGRDRRLAITATEAIGGLRPRADLLIDDAAALLGPNLLLVVLTGMGSDGLEGARKVRAAGGRILCEDESSCVVYGMPRSVVEAGLADEVLPLDELPAAIAREVGA